MLDLLYKIRAKEVTNDNLAQVGMILTFWFDNIFVTYPRVLMSRTLI